MQNRAAFQTLFHFLPTKESWQLKKDSLIVEGNTQTTPNKENNNYHRTLNLTQFRRMWSIDSSLTLQRKHLFNTNHPPVELNLRALKQISYGPLQSA